MMHGQNNIKLQNATSIILYLKQPNVWREPSTTNSCSGLPGIKSQRGDRLSWGICCSFLSCSTPVLEYYLKLGRESFLAHRFLPIFATCTVNDTNF